MAEMMLVRDAAKLWGLTERRVASLCKEGKIEGVQKKGRSWLIPVDARRPMDSRVKSGVYKKPSRRENLPLPVGVSDYRLASTEYYYVDKTLLLKAFLDERPMVSLFTRPRRFGKTLNMDMIRTFFEKTEEDTSVYFRNKKIWSCGQKYREYQGKYPVIFVTFKDVKCETWEETLSKIAEVLSNEFSRHGEVLDSAECNEQDKLYFRQAAARELDATRLESAFSTLSRMLHQCHGVAPILIVDEYDTPIQQGYMRDFYDRIILFMRNLFSGGLKDNRHLSYGFLTGILRVAKESIFSGLNNLAINSILDSKYSQFFGFTPEEVGEIAAYYGAKDKYGEIEEWYDGYRFGNTEIFNPWSVINYFRNDQQPGAYWQATGSNDILSEVLSNADEEIYERLHALLRGESFLTYIDTDVIYPEIRSNPSSVYSFLLVSGYLKFTASDLFGAGYMCQVAVPNKEIAFVYNKEILQKLENIIPQATAISIQQAIYSGDAKQLQASLRKLLLQSASCYDTAGENFYHGLVLGLCAMLDNRYAVTSNREAGEGRYDIQLLPRAKNLPGILIELKAARGVTGEELKTLSETALQQIQEKRYDTEMAARGVAQILKYGVAFSGKNVEICVG